MDKELAEALDRQVKCLDVMLDIQKISLKNETRIIEIMTEMICFTTMIADRLVELLDEKK